MKSVCVVAVYTICMLMLSSCCGCLYNLHVDAVVLLARHVLSLNVKCIYLRVCLTGFFYCHMIIVPLCIRMQRGNNERTDDNGALFNVLLGHLPGGADGGKEPFRL